jgi:hypothetical protein
MYNLTNKICNNQLESGETAEPDFLYEGLAAIFRTCMGFVNPSMSLSPE